MQKFLSNLRYPMLTMIGVGFLAGILIGGVMFFYSERTIKELKVENQELYESREKIREEFTKKVSVLAEINEQLKQKTKRITKTHRDGTTEEVVEQETDRSKETTQRFEETLTEVRVSVKEIKEVVSQLYNERQTIVNAPMVTFGVTLDKSLTKSLFVERKVFGNLGLGFGINERFDNYYGIVTWSF